ncbi:HEAT repeat domain-containing protein [Cytophagaceae bacterium DM2B3-1]|uniref:HEAT repeat domain-containing protein n=1 Tax=Xanthocytophaga flava TaxID=3048013 RepID=A0ABT7CGV1_9BACT|nr:HEAT repeat domain-containing protein [Xanthocytophaga flavus]MDJ1492963.1 HEAT repeat domain-containing protein [Xanthocytophaga flavus]
MTNQTVSSDIVSFIESYIQLEYEALLAEYTEAVFDRYWKKSIQLKVYDLVTLYHIGNKRHSRIHLLSEQWVKDISIQPRSLYCIHHYQCTKVGDVFVCYVGPLGKETDPFAWYVARFPEGFRIVSENTIDSRTGQWEKGPVRGMQIPIQETDVPVAVYRFQIPSDSVTLEKYQAFADIQPSVENLPSRGIFEELDGFFTDRYFCRVPVFGLEHMATGLIEDLNWEESDELSLNLEYSGYDLVYELQETVSKAMEKERVDMGSWVYARLCYLSKAFAREWNNRWLGGDGGGKEFYLLIADKETQAVLGILHFEMQPGYLSIDISERSNQLSRSDFYRDFRTTLLNEPLLLACCSLIVSDYEQNRFPWEYGWDGKCLWGENHSQLSELLPVCIAIHTGFSVEERLKALETIWNIRSTHLWEFLTRFLKDQAPQMRQAAATYLVQLRDRRAIPALEQLLEIETVESVRLAALSALLVVTNLPAE